MKQIRGPAGVDRGRYLTRTAGSLLQDSRVFRTRRQQAEAKPLGFGKDEKQSLARRGPAVPAATSRKERSATALQRMILRRGHF